MNRKKIIVLISIALVFIALRLFVLPVMYQQDEYKWGEIVNPAFGIHFESDHLPLVSVLYLGNGLIAGFNHLRLLPFAVSILNLILVFFIARRLYGIKAAVLSTAILAVSVYSVIAGTQVDIDGALLPLPFLLAVFAYINAAWDKPFEKGNRKWLALLFSAFILGFSVKLSFVLAAGAIVTDYLLTRRFKVREIWKPAVFTIVAAAVAGAIILILNKIFGVANSGRFLANTEKFGLLNFGARNYFQVLFLGTKSLILASPLLVVPFLIAISKNEFFKKFRLWLIFISYNLLFYLLIFDFTNRTIERYMMFFIIPAAIIAGAIIVQVLDEKSPVFLKKGVYVFNVSSIILAIAGYFIWTANFPALPLNPKSAYLDKIFHLDFNFLIPITGGSGPIGFYVPVIFIAVFFIIALAGGIIFRLAKSFSWRQNAAVALLAAGLVYNGFMMTEFVSGFFYGSVDKMAKTLTKEVVNNPKIDKVITYYDIAGYELNAAGKYGRRFYTDPMFAETNKGKFQDFKGYFEVLDFPMIDKNGVYWKYFQTCEQIYSVSDKKVSGYIFDCRSGNRGLFATSN
jgi:hypothetical protein